MLTASLVVSTGLASSDNVVANNHSKTGQLVFLRKENLWIADSEGKHRSKLLPGMRVKRPAISANGKYVAFELISDRGLAFNRIQLLPVGGGVSRELDFKDFEAALYPSFSPDSRKLVFVGLANKRERNSGNGTEIVVDLALAQLDLETGQVSSLLTRKDAILGAEIPMQSPVFFPDAQRVIFYHAQSEVFRGLRIADLSGRVIWEYPKPSESPIPLFGPKPAPDGEQVLCYSLHSAKVSNGDVQLVDPQTLERLVLTQGARPVFVDQGRAIVYEFWRSGKDGKPVADLWKISRAPSSNGNAKPRLIIKNASEPAGR